MLLWICFLVLIPKICPQPVVTCCMAVKYNNERESSYILCYFNICLKRMRKSVS
jgi:hypothetical protein